MATGSTTDAATTVTDAILLIEHTLNSLPPKTALQLNEFCRRRLDANEARILANRFDNGATDRDVADMAAGTDGKTSKAEAKKRAVRAKATNANPDLANKIANGELSTEQADVLAGAAADTNGEAACDEELINDIANTTPEQGRKKARKYVTDRLNADGVQKRHDKQHRQRGYYRHRRRLPNGNAAITIHGSDESIDEFETHIKTAADIEYHNDGGRNVPSHKHSRTNDQRGFDAAHKLITGTPTSRSTGNTPTRAMLHINITTDQITGVDTSPILTSDGKPLPQTLVDELACTADIIGHIFSTNGELLWQTVKQRLATTAQINGLIARDGGCTLCNRHYSQCVAHHLLPWEAPERGETNIDNLALVCIDCHTAIHQRKLTLFYDPPTQTWKTRAAKPHEIPRNHKYDGPKAASRYPRTSTNNAAPNTEPHITTTEPSSRPHLHELRQTKRLRLFDG